MPQLLALVDGVDPTLKYVCSVLAGANVAQYAWNQWTVRQHRIDLREMLPVLGEVKLVLIEARTALQEMKLIVLELRKP